MDQRDAIRCLEMSERTVEDITAYNKILAHSL